MTTRELPASTEVAVVGAGQAGLAMGYFLAAEGRQFAIVDGAPAVGASWRNRWESLVLFTPRRYDCLPGLQFPGDPEGYPTRDEVAAYLSSYADTFALPVHLGTPVDSLAARGDGFVLSLGGWSLEAQQVVVATGPFQKPRLPEIASDLGADVFQTHSADYRTPSDIPRGTVLVVGGGNTGYQIASELSKTHDVHLAIGGRQTPLPQRILGRDLFWWLVTTRLFSTTIESRLGKKLGGRETLIGSSPRRAKRDGVTVRPRAVAASERSVTFADGSGLAVDALIWATGFRLDHTWIDLPVADGNGGVRHRQGVSDVRGLYFLGLPWQHTRGSALLGWVKDDAGFLARRIAADNRPERAAPKVAAVR